MKLLACCAALCLCSISVLHAADLVSGTWTSTNGTTVRVYVFKASGDRLTGIVCGPCDNPGTVFRIEDGRILSEDRATFFVRNSDGRQRVDASLTRNVMILTAQSEAGVKTATTSVTLARVVQDFELSPQAPPPSPASSGKAPAAPVEGHWVSVGRMAQQNWILKAEGAELWGLVCGPCTPAVVTMIDGRIDGDTILFYINHIDTPPNPARKGIQRNVMTGTVGGADNTNILKFKWTSEGSGNTGEITMIGPVR
jgi:hypothetical protein